MNPEVEISPPPGIGIHVNHPPATARDAAGNEYVAFMTNGGWGPGGCIVCHVVDGVAQMPPLLAPGNLAAFPPQLKIFASNKQLYLVCYGEDRKLRRWPVPGWVPFPS